MSPQMIERRTEDPSAAEAGTELEYALPPPAVLPKHLPTRLPTKFRTDGKRRASLGPASMRTPYGFHINRRRDQPVEGTERGWRARSDLTPSAVGARTSFEGGLCQAACDQSKRGPICDHRSRCRSSEQRHSVSRHHVSSAPLPAASVDRYGRVLGGSGVRAFVKQPVAVVARHKLLIAVLACRYDARRGWASEDRIFGMAERTVEVSAWQRGSTIRVALKHLLENSPSLAGQSAAARLADRGIAAAKLSNVFSVFAMMIIDCLNIETHRFLRALRSGPLPPASNSNCFSISAENELCIVSYSEQQLVVCQV